MDNMYFKNNLSSSLFFCSYFRHTRKLFNFVQFSIVFFFIWSGKHIGDNGDMSGSFYLIGFSNKLCLHIGDNGDMSGRFYMIGFSNKLCLHIGDNGDMSGSFYMIDFSDKLHLHIGDNGDMFSNL